MKITYTCPNRAHHYPLVKALNKRGVLHAFVSGFSRLSPRASIKEIGKKLKRRDIFQTIFVLGLKLRLPRIVLKYLNIISSYYLDYSSLKWAKESDFFIFYRTHGLRTTRKLKEGGYDTICIMEEVNAHVDYYLELMEIEYQSLGLGNFDYELPDYRKRLQAYDECDFILVPSNFVKNSFLEKGFSEEKLILQNYGFDNQILDVKEKPNDSFIVLYVGQLNFRKGLHYAIKAFQDLDFDNKEFYIVGERNGVTGLENFDIPDNVYFTGALKGKDLEEQYKSAHVFILPSIEDGFGLVVGEALSYGVPVIVTENCGGADIVVDGFNGFIVPAFDSASILEKFNVLIEDRTLLFRMSLNTIETPLLNWDLTVDDLIKKLKNNNHVLVERK
jgi:glycosyltransferase involved in cell wall biosynthesis